MTIPAFANEAGNFVAHKKNASLVFFTSAPFIFPWIASAVGNPINPSYMPIPLLPYSQEMNFKERFLNTIGTLALQLGRRYFILPKVEAMISEVFPNEPVPNLHEISQTAALAINHGSPFLGDGLRPTLPNTVLGR